MPVILTLGRRWQVGQPEVKGHPLIRDKLEVSIGYKRLHLKSGISPHTRAGGLQKTRQNKRNGPDSHRA